MTRLALAFLAAFLVSSCGGSKKDAEMPEMEEETVDENDNPVAEPEENSTEKVAPAGDDGSDDGGEGDDGDDSGDDGDDGSDDPDAEDGADMDDSDPE